MTKKILKISAILFLVIILIIGVLIALNYKADIPVEELKTKYTLKESNWVQIQDINVHYTIDGNSEKTILILHGTGGSLHDWQEWTDILKENYRVIRLDLPGFGLTGPNPKNRYDLLFYMVFLENFVHKLQLKSFHITGNSFGAYLAWNYTLKHPQQIEKVALLNSSGYPRQNASLPIGFKLAKNKTLSPLIEKITPKSLVRKTVLAAFEDDLLVTEQLVNRYYELLLREGNRKGVSDRLQQVSYDNWRDIKNISKPTLIMWGDKDEIVPPEHAYKFHKDIAQSEFIMYNDIGHVPMQEIPSRSVNDFLKFLNDIPKLID